MQNISKFIKVNSFVFFNVSIFIFIQIILYGYCWFDDGSKAIGYLLMKINVLILHLAFMLIYLLINLLNKNKEKIRQIVKTIPILILAFLVMFALNVSIEHIKLAFRSQ